MVRSKCFIPSYFSSDGVQVSLESKSKACVREVDHNAQKKYH